MNTSSPPVSVALFTYNHEKYIRDSVEAILAQKTSFEFEFIISDDLSTDGTRSILLEYQKKYPEKIRLVLNEENLGLVKHFRNVMAMCRGRYISSCAGDDYWHHPHKLQKQFDFLEAHPDYGLVHTDYRILYEKTNTIRPSNNPPVLPTGQIFEKLLERELISAATVMIRREMVQRFYTELHPKYLEWTVEDRGLWLFTSLHSKIMYLPEETLTYRIAEGSITHQRNLSSRARFYAGVTEIEKYFADHYPCSEKAKQTALLTMNKRLLLLYYYQNDKHHIKPVYLFLKQHQKLSIRHKFYYYTTVSRILRFIFFPVKKLYWFFKKW